MEKQSDLGEKTEYMEYWYCPEHGQISRSEFEVRNRFGKYLAFHRGCGQKMKALAYTKTSLYGKKTPLNLATMVSEKLGRTNREVNCKRWKLGIRLDPEREQRRIWRRNTIIKLYKEGHSKTQIAKELGTVIQNVNFYLSQAGLCKSYQTQKHN